MTTENEEILELEVPIVTWDMVREHRNQMLLEAEKGYNFDTPDSVTQLWLDYKQELRDIPNKFKDLEDLNQIEWPAVPTAHLQELYLSRLAPNN
jgi:Phage tail assembly chaperone protein